jgi:hypothetical protein
MKNYALFAGGNYYPNGGAGDFVAYFETHQKAVDAGQQLEKNWDDYLENKVSRPTRECDWWHVASAATMEIVATND